MPPCQRCKTLTIDELVGTEIPFQPDLPTLKQNAERGCDFCSLCWGVLQNADKTQLQRLLQGQSAWADGEEWTPTIWLLGLGIMNRGRLGATIEVSCGKLGTVKMPDGEREPGQNPQPSIAETLTLYETPGQISRYNLHGRRSTADQNPELYLQLIRSWLNDCQTNHATCKASDSGTMPTRVIDVGIPGTAEPHVRLVSTGGLNERYLALSYCWGADTSGVYTLNRHTHAIMTRGIEEPALAKTHREVISLARALGIRYVWVDALCIIQGDVADWETESKTMARVYGNATLTIIAGRSPGSKNGFLTNELKNQHRPPPCQLRVSSESQTSSETLTVDLRRSHDIGPLVKRGWCFQERLSAPRAVMFAEQQIAFQCNKEQFWEDGRADRNAWRPKFVQQQPQWTRDPKIPLSPVEETLKDWYLMIFHYSQCLLSNPHDVFAAICAVAQQAARTLVGSRYLAGIWECDMVRGLLWRPCYHFQSGPAARTPTARPKPTKLTGGTGPVIRAPSWSWAAVEGPVAHDPWNPSRIAKHRDPAYSMIRPGCPDSRWSFDTKCGVDTLHMLECELQLFGRVSSALILRESVMDYLEVRKKRGRIVVPRPKVVDHGVMLVSGEESRDDRPNDEPWQDRVVGLAFFDDTEERNGVDGVWCLLVSTDMGLILKRNADESLSRLGWFSVEKESWLLGQPEICVSLR